MNTFKLYIEEKELKSPQRTYYTSGQPETEVWWNQRGVLNRLDGPAFRRWFKNGQLATEWWFRDGKMHRLNGPAYQTWDVNGQRRRKGWYIDDIEYDTEACYWKKMFEMVKQGEIKNTVNIEVDGLTSLI